MLELPVFYLALVLVDKFELETVLMRIVIYCAMWALLSVGMVQFQLYLTPRLPPGMIQPKYTLFLRAFRRVYDKCDETGDMAKLHNWSRYMRSQVYCTFAGAAGLYLLITDYHHWPLDLLLHWNDLCRPCFEVAIAHWIVSFVEDQLASAEATTHMVILPAKQHEIHQDFTKKLRFHHMITILAFTWSICTHKLAGLCVFGLVFEIPVLLLNVRDFIGCFGEELEYPWKKLNHHQFKLYVYLITLLWHIFRSIPCALWPLSLLVWRSELVKVPLFSRIFYHLLGAMFMYVNVHIFFVVISRYHREDLYRMDLISIEQLFEALGESLVSSEQQQQQKKKGEVQTLSSLLEGSKKDAHTAQPGQVVTAAPGTTSTISIADLEAGSASASSSSSSDSNVAPPTSILMNRDVSAQYGRESPVPISADTASSYRSKKGALEQRRNGKGDTSSSAPAASGETSCPFSGKTKQSAMQQGVSLQLVGTDEVAQHNTEDDCWLIISGSVYDVTGFLKKHPGGAKIISDLAGADATKAYIEVGHSGKARKMMDDYLIGKVLPGGYGQMPVKSEHQRMSDLAVKQQDLLEAPYYAGCDYMFWATEGSYFGFTISYSVAVVLILAALRDASSSMIKTASSGVAVATQAASSVAISTAAAMGASAVTSEAVKHTAQATVEEATRLLSAVTTTEAAAHSLALSLSSITTTAMAHVKCVYLAGVLFAAVNYGLTHVGAHVIDEGMDTKEKVKMAGNAVKALMMSADAYKPLIQWRVHVSTLVMLSLIGSEAFLMSIAVSCRHSAIRYFGLSLLVTLAGETFARRINYSCLSNTTMMETKSVSLFPGFCLFVALIAFVQSLRATNGLPAFSVGFLMVPVASGLVRMCHVRLLNDNRFSYGGVGLQTYSHISTMFCVGMLYVIIISALLMPGVNDNDAPLLVAGSVLLNLFNPTLLIAYAAYMYSIVMTGNVIKWSTPAFASQTASMIVLLTLCALISPQSRAEKYSLGAFVLSCLAISVESSRTLQVGGRSAPKHLYVAKMIEDDIRQTLAGVLGMLIVAPCTDLVSLIAPDGLRMYLFPSLVYDLGSKCDVGIAYQVNGNPQMEPKIFQCNVGHLSGGPDLYQTTLATKNMMKELIDDPELGEKGFVSDTVAIFPISASQRKERKLDYQWRELNLSAWASPKAAHDWYTNSHAHKQIVKQYYGAELDDFGSMLAQLVPDPAKPIRWEVRCWGCKKMVHGPDVTICPYCKDPMTSLPYM